eukprot:scaffold72113_cov82-Phaeocystis_antarctica.AAC.2
MSTGDNSVFVSPDAALEAPLVQIDNHVGRPLERKMHERREVLMSLPKAWRCGVQREEHTKCTAEEAISTVSRNLAPRKGPLLHREREQVAYVPSLVA